MILCCFAEKTKENSILEAEPYALVLS